jgi:transketolase
LLSGVAAAHKPVPFEFVNGGDRFGESGTPAELIEEFGLNAANIAAAAKKAIARK